VLFPKSITIDNEVFLSSQSNAINNAMESQKNVMKKYMLLLPQGDKQYQIAKNGKVFPPESWHLITRIDMAGFFLIVVCVKTAFLWYLS